TLAYAWKASARSSTRKLKRCSDGSGILPPHFGCNRCRLRNARFLFSRAGSMSAHAQAWLGHRGWPLGCLARSRPSFVLATPSPMTLARITSTLMCSSRLRASSFSSVLWLQVLRARLSPFQVMDQVTPSSPPFQRRATLWILAYRVRRDLPPTSPHPMLSTGPSDFSDRLGTLHLRSGMSPPVGSNSSKGLMPTLFLASSLRCFPRPCRRG